MHIIKKLIIYLYVYFWKTCLVVRFMLKKFIEECFLQNKFHKLKEIRKQDCSQL